MTPFERAVVHHLKWVVIWLFFIALNTCVHIKIK